MGNLTKLGLCGSTAYLVVVPMFPPFDDLISHKKMTGRTDNFAYLICVWCMSLYDFSVGIVTITRVTTRKTKVNRQGNKNLHCDISATVPLLYLGCILLSTNSKLYECIPKHRIKVLYRRYILLLCRKQKKYSPIHQYFNEQYLQVSIVLQDIPIGHPGYKQTKN